MKSLIIKLVMFMIGMVILACNQGDKKSMETINQETDSIQEAQISKEPSNIFENEYARVFIETLEPGKQQTEHEGLSRVIYSLNDYMIEWNENGQNAGAKEWKKGNVHIHKPANHYAKNLSNKPAEWLVFVRTGNELPACEQMSSKKDVASAKDGFATALAEDENFKVVSVKLSPGQMIDKHDGLNRLVYSLSDYTLSYTDDADKTQEKEFKKGDIHWHNGCAHSLKNSGTTEAEFVLVSFKK
ncbi:MAG: hypothetical protein U5K51_03675 [Flavobacteriaceae bacterium]|nr:hypothetical protein [Flavobacteriaceae bacterium]